MELTDWKIKQKEQLMKWASDLETMPLPDELQPKCIAEYPKYLKNAERLRDVSKFKRDEYRDKIQELKDGLSKVIEESEIVISLGRRGALPKFKKEFATVASRERELRIRLGKLEGYAALKEEADDWERVHKDWVAHINFLRRELRLKEVTWQANGGEGVGL